MKKVNELRGLSNEEMNLQLAELRSEISKEMGHVASGTRPENPGKIRAMRKKIARILTIQHEKNAKKAGVSEKK